MRSVGISILRAVIFFMVISGFGTYTLEAQLFFNVAGNYGYMHYNHNYLPSPPEVTTSTTLDILVSVSPIWWFGKQTAVELEIGYWTSFVQFENQGEMGSIDYIAQYIIPHFFFSPLRIDSLLSPYVKAGIGLLRMVDEYPFGYSGGIGVLILPENNLVFRVELNFKYRTANTGSRETGRSSAHLDVIRDWGGVYYIVALGIRI